MNKESKLLFSQGNSLMIKLNNFEMSLNSFHTNVTDKHQIKKLRIQTDSMKNLPEKYEEIIFKLEIATVNVDELLKPEVFYNKHLDLITRAELLLESNSKQQTPDSPSTSTSTSQSDNNTSSGNAGANAKLPKISLPTFDGSYTSFTSYLEAFTALIHNNSKLSDIEKFLYLKGSLRGQASQTISSIQPSAENYKIAFDLLRDRYDNPKLIILNHIKGIMNLKSISKRSGTELRKLYDEFSRHIRALSNLSIPVDEAVAFIYYIITSKLDPDTKSKFTEYKSHSIPTLDEINDFLKDHCQLLEEIEANQKSAGSFHSSSSSKTQQAHVMLMTAQQTSCQNCNGDHHISQCSQFLSLSPQQRFDKVNSLRICKNCLRHSSKNTCHSKYDCRICHKRHHTLLHLGKGSNSKPDSVSNTDTNVDHTSEVPVHENSKTSLSVIQRTNLTEVLLSTVNLRIKASNNRWISARAVLDSGSHINFITKDLVSKLRLKGNPVTTKIVGINSCSAESHSIVQIQIASLTNSFQTCLQCLVIPKITEDLPSRSFDKSQISIPSNLKLADDNFNESQPVDILIGAGSFYNLLSIGQIALGEGKPVLQKTLFGWVVSGPLPSTSQINCFSSYILTNEIALEVQEPLDSLIQQFWKLENIQIQNPLSKMSLQERFCEEHFSKTVARASDGRFLVSIPFNANLQLLGESKTQATERFMKLEKRFQNNPAFRKSYTQFINEYICLGHMKKVTNSLKSTCSESITVYGHDSPILLSNIPEYYMPHHAVFKADSTTTKLRVVFDASTKSTTGASLNDVQLVGPVLQNDLNSILLRFRQHPIVLVGDIEKMYRQMLVRPELTKFQKIVWRDNPQALLDTYELQTVTYGTSSASYLATKCLQHLAELNYSCLPKGSLVLKSDFYMDDLLTGGNTVEEVLEIKNQLVSILNSAKFHLRKLRSNSPLVLCSNDQTGFCSEDRPLSDRDKTKTLGLVWNSVHDYLQFNIPVTDFNTSSNTKRGVLAVTAQIFDPLGLLAPFIILMKILIQRLWQFKLSWDESIPTSINTEWQRYKGEFSLLHSLQIPRFALSADYVSLELHGFCDSSEKAFGACVYTRSINNKHDFNIHLLCSKSRVAPLHTITIPRLELCSALLLAQLMQKVKFSLTIEISKIYYWCDSSITLSWINSAPNKHKTFVANRIASIQELSDPKDWRHVPSEENPADLISRGCSASNLVSNSLWWHGPPFLSLSDEWWPTFDKETQFHKSSEQELKACSNIASSLISTLNDNLFEAFSNLTKLIRVVSWILRFVNNTSPSRSSRNYFNYLTSAELSSSLHRLVKLCQSQSFEQEIKALKDHRQLKSSNISSLNPFLDEQGIIRVGGRIRNSEFVYDKKHPILLPKGHLFTILIFRSYHINLLHCGPQQLLAVVRNTYWPISGTLMAKSTVRHCVQCFRSKPQSYEPFMGDLPMKRLDFKNPAFSHVGIDYAGPVLIKDKKLRGAKLIKAYICVFVCLTTKGIHLELVTSLSTDAFIAMLRRFIGRRGKPISISSDNAKTFVGAANHLKEIYAFLKSKEVNNKISSFTADQGIRWEFIIPLNPHQGGMWESAVKSVKKHLHRVLGNIKLNYEDFMTLLIRIEAVLNSRPLGPSSNNPCDFTPLTPAHFLIGKPLCDVPELDLETVPENRLSLYQQIQKQVQIFWNRWSLEVVPELQRRVKWFTRLPELIKINSLVLIQDKQTSPLQWKLGRVVCIHHSPDKVIRSVTLKLANGQTLKRAVHQLCVFPD